MDKIKPANVGKKLGGAAQVLLEVGEALVDHRSQRGKNFVAGMFVDALSPLVAMLALDRGDMKKLSKVTAESEAVVKEEGERPAPRPEHEEVPLNITLFTSGCGELAIARARVFLDENADKLRLAIKKDAVETLAESILKKASKLFDPLEDKAVFEKTAENLGKLLAKFDEDLSEWAP